MMVKNGGFCRMNDFIVFPKTGRMIWLGVMCAVFVLLGVVFIGFSIIEDDAFWLGIVGAAIIVIFGLCIIYYVKEIMNRKPALIVSDVGIMDRSSFIGAGLIKWEEIADIDFINFSGQLFLGIFTHDPELIINRTNGIKSVLNKLNKGLIDAQVNIPVKNLGCSMGELVEVINNRWDKTMEDSKA